MAAALLPQALPFAALVACCKADASDCRKPYLFPDRKPLIQSAAPAVRPPFAFCTVELRRYTQSGRRALRNHSTGLFGGNKGPLHYSWSISPVKNYFLLFVASGSAEDRRPLLEKGPGALAHVRSG